MLRRAFYYRTWLVSFAPRGYPQLYDLQLDPSESYSVAARYPDVLRDTQSRLERAQSQFASYKRSTP